MDGSVAEHRPLLALAIRLGAIAALSTMSALIKFSAETGVHLVEILFWRQALSIPLVMAWAAITTGSLSVLRTRRLGGHAKRGI